MLNRHNQPFKSDLQNLIHGFNESDRQTGENLRRYFRQVFLIVLRKQYGTQAHSVGRQKFFFDAADGQDLAAKGNFSGHGDVTAHRDARQGADDGVANRDAGGRAVLGDSAFGDVHVNIDVAVKI